MAEHNRICTTETRLTIHNIPIKIISDILELIEPIYRHAIRKVSRSLRAAVDAKTSGIKVISFWMGSQQDFRLFFDGFRVRYTQNDSDCILKWGTFEKNEKVIKKGCASEIAFNDFGRLLTSKLNNLTVWLGEENEEFRKKTFQSLKVVLNSARYIDAKKLTLNSFSAEEMAQLMSNFKERSLQDIVINPTENLGRFAEIVQLRQWKHAKTFLWDNSKGKLHSDVVPIEHFFHFKRFSANYHIFSIQDAFKVRDLANKYQKNNGFCTNWAIVLIMVKVTELRKPFTILTVGLATSDGVFSTLYLFYATPMVFFVNEYLAYWSHLCGYILMICYKASTYFHFIISLNRFLSVFTPIFYNQMFNIKFTKYIVMGIYLLSFGLITLFFQILGCQNYYNAKYLAFQYSGGKICRWYGTYGDFYQVFTLTITSAFLNFSAIWKVAKLRTKSVKNSIELNWLKQSLSQTLFVLIIVCCFTWGPRLLPDKKFTFIFSSILWAAVHCFDGIITLVFNSEIWRKIFSTGSAVIVVSTVRTKTACKVAPIKFKSPH